MRGLYYTPETAARILKSRGLVVGRDLRRQHWLRLDRGSPRAVRKAVSATGARFAETYLVSASEVERLAARRLRDAARRLVSALRVRAR